MTTPAACAVLRSPPTPLPPIHPLQVKGCIKVLNNGAGIPVEVHKTEGIYVPELIFGNLLTSSNYNDNEKKVRCNPCLQSSATVAVEGWGASRGTGTGRRSGREQSFVFAALRPATLKQLTRVRCR